MEPGKQEIKKPSDVPASPSKPSTQESAKVEAKPIDDKNIRATQGEKSVPPKFGEKAP